MNTKTDNKTGLAKRPISFPDTAMKAETFKGTIYTVEKIMGLIARMGEFIYQSDDGTERRLSHGAVRLLLLLVSYTDSLKWESGNVFVWLSNATLAEELGASIRQMQSYLFELEEAGLIARRYDCGNERLKQAGIDLRPFGHRLDEISKTIQDRYDARAVKHEARKHES